VTGAVLSNVAVPNGIPMVSPSATSPGLSDSFISNFETSGGTVTLNAPHEDNKADYSAEIGALTSAGGDLLVVLGYSDSGGKRLIQAALDTGAFDTFMMGDGMYGDALVADLGGDMEGSFGAVRGARAPVRMPSNPSRMKLESMANPRSRAKATMPRR
jgi:branched-chain amino acid transport system substrate-binding protein